MSGGHVVKIAVLDVGQGDTIIVSIPDTREAVVVDCIDAAQVIDYIGSEGIEYVRGLLITHLHMDHYSESIAFLSGCQAKLGTPCEKVLYNWAQPSAGMPRDKLLQDDDEHSDDPRWSATRRKNARSSILRDLKLWAETNDGLCERLTTCDRGKLPLNGEICNVLSVLQPSHGQIGLLQDISLNNSSSVIQVYGPGTSALLTGDIEVEGWQLLQTRYNSGQLRSDVLKFPHHGAWKNGDARKLLADVGPSHVVISVGADSNGGNQYGHPNRHVLDAIYQRPTITLRCTEVTTECRQAAARLKLGKCACSGRVVYELSGKVSVLT